VNVLKLARFIFLRSSTQEAQCKQRNITYNSEKIETGLEKNSSKQHPSPEIPGPMTPPTPPESPFPSVGGGEQYNSCFLDLYFREFTAAINFPCSKSGLRIGETDVIFSQILQGLKL